MVCISRCLCMCCPINYRATFSLWSGVVCCIEFPFPSDDPGINSVALYVTLCVMFMTHSASKNLKPDLRRPGLCRCTTADSPGGSVLSIHHPSGQPHFFPLPCSPTFCTQFPSSLSVFSASELPACRSLPAQGRGSSLPARLWPVSESYLCLPQLSSAPCAQRLFLFLGFLG